MVIRSLCTLLSALLASPSWAQGTDPGRLSDLHEYLTRLEKLGFAGVVAISQNGSPEFAAGYGLADREEHVPWNPATVSTIGSITKQFTGAAILRLQDQDKLSVQDPITKYFEDVPEGKQAITLHQLLTHSSGIVDLEDGGDFDPIDRQDFIRRALDQELAFPPGEEYDYSNAGYSLLGAVIEQLSGISYEAFLRREFLAPGGLYETGYLLPLWGKGRLAQGYTDDGRWGTVLERPFAVDGPYWVLRANGGIHSTGYDMLRWAQALLGGQVLSPQSMESYWSPHVDEGGGTFYGYGWVVDRIGDQKVITHNGGNGIFFADMAILPESRLAVFLQTNVRGPLPMVERLLGQILHYLVAGEPLPRLPRIVATESSRLSPFAGSFDLQDGGSLRVSLETGSLLITPDDPRAFAYLLSTRPVDLQRTQRLSARIDSIVSAYVKGDVRPLWEAYSRRVTLEYLTQILDQRMQSLEEEHGALQRHQTLGTALRTEREISLVRLYFENGFTDRAYVWRKGTGEDLLGVSRRGLALSQVFYPEGVEEFASWDPRTGESRPMSIERDEEGHLRLRLGEGDLMIEGVKR